MTKSVAAASLALFLLLTAAVVTGRTAPFDLALRSQIHNLSITPLTSAMMIVTYFGSLQWIAPAALATVLLLRLEGHKRQTIIVAVVVVGSIPIEYGAKLIVQRPRPEAFFDIEEPTTYSFPSGHALFSTSLYGALACVSAQLAKHRLQRVIFWLAATASIAAICLSRVYLGVHYPTDVAGGVLIACAWMNAVLIFVK